MTFIQWRTLDKSPYTRYQKNTAMFNWSPTLHDHISFIDDADM